MSDQPDVETSIRRLAKLLRMSISTAESYAAQGIFVRSSPAKYWQDASVGNYVERIRKAGTGRDTQQAKTKDREYAARAALTEYKLASLKGETLMAAEVERALTGLMRYLRAGILALPKRIQGLDRHQMAQVGNEARALLSELAEAKTVAGVRLVIDDSEPEGPKRKKAA